MRIQKSNGKLFVELPPSLSSSFPEGTPYALIELTEGFILIARSDKLAAFVHEKLEPLLSSPKSPPPLLTDEEVQVIAKLDAVRFAERTEERIAKTLSPSERTVLARLKEKNLVSLYKGKYDKPVYNIDDHAYEYFKRIREQVRKHPPSLSSESPPQKSSSSLDTLFTHGYCVLKSEEEARQVSALLEQSIKNREVYGTRAFDKNFYVVTKSYFEAHAPRVLAALRKEAKSAHRLAEELSLPLEGVLALLAVLLTEGDIIEKRKNLFTCV